MSRGCHGQGVLPGLDVGPCLHPVGRLAYLDAAQLVVCCRDCGEVLDVPELPVEVQNALG